MQANKMPQESNIKTEGGKKEIKIPTARDLWIPVGFKPVFTAFFTEKTEDLR